MNEFITYNEWVKLVAKTLDAMLTYNYLPWDDRMKMQKVAMGTVVVLPPDELPPLGNVT